MLASMMKLLGVSSEQAVQPEYGEAWQCQAISCVTSSRMKVYCNWSENPYYCDILSNECC